MPVVTSIKASPALAAATGGIRHCEHCRAIYRQDFQRCPLDGEALTIAAVDPWLGASVGAHYIIESRIGEGAMGRVYAAHRADVPERRYAIKIMIGDLAASSQMRQRFELEAEHAAQLAHPNVVGVVDYGTTERGLGYIVMELVEGCTLGQLVMQGPMDPARVIRIARQLCLGLEHAHSRGMIHRDFKPDNILVVGEGELEVARIADFGLALSTTDEVRLTTTGIVCTPAYAAPEQLRGLPIDHRVDLYALGTTLFEMLSGGILPFNHADVDASVSSKLAGEAPSVLMVAPQVPPSLVSIVGRLLSSQPARRPRSARSVIRALDGALAAPRAVFRTEDTAPIRRPRGVEPAATSAVTKAVPSRPRKVVAARTPTPARRRETPSLARPPSRFRRRLVQLFACGLTVGGALAWFDLRDAEALREPASALAAPLPQGLADEEDTSNVTLVVRAEAIEPAASPAARVAPKPAPEPAPAPAPAAAPMLTVRSAPSPRPRTVRSHVRARAAAAVHAADENVLLEADFDDPAQLSPARLARTYRAIGRELRRLDAALGRANTDDLWAAYGALRVADANSSEAAMTETAGALQQIQEAIVDRGEAPGDD